MYRIAFKTNKGLRIGINTLTLEQARSKKNFFNTKNKGSRCIIITEQYVLGQEEFKEVA